MTVPTRREFLKTAGAAGLGLASAGVIKAAVAEQAAAAAPIDRAPAAFNMCGHAAPKLERVRAGVIGLGSRGTSTVRTLASIEGIDVTAVCDLRPDHVQKVIDSLRGSRHQPRTYSGGNEDWKYLCDQSDVDVVYICTPWDLHTPMATFAMEHGRHVAVEVPAAVTIDECWQLVETSEKTRRHCRMLENCCYDFFELLTWNMARRGFFGEIVHADGAYLHNLLASNFRKDGYYDMWRLKQNRRHGNLYPTHGLGPICQLMNVNRGDQMDFLVSVSSRDFQMGPRARELAQQDSFYAPFAHTDYRGNMNVTTIRTFGGRTIMLQHDVTSPRPYSRIHHVIGTKASAAKWPLPAKIAVGDEWVDEARMRELEQEFTPAFVKALRETARANGGHGGMDYLMHWHLAQRLINGEPMDHDVYDAALWSAIAPLSEQSVAMRSQSVTVPDFTRGQWRANPPVDLDIAVPAASAVPPMPRT